jgi:hypothetical protein
MLDELVMMTGSFWAFDFLACRFLLLTVFAYE